MDTAITGAAHNDCAPAIESTAIDLTMTCHIDHIADHPHIGVLQVTNLEIAVGHINDHPSDLQDRTHIDKVHTPAEYKENHTPRRT